MKKITFLLLCILLLSGCKSNNDINNIAVISIIGIDYREEEDQYDVFLKVLASNSQNEESILRESCEKIESCFHSFSQSIMKRIYLTHVDLLILGNTLEKKEYQEIFEFFLNESTSRNSFSTIVIDHLDESLLNVEEEDIRHMLELSISTNGLVQEKNLEDVIKEVLNQKVSYLPYLETQEKIAIKGYKSIYEENKILSEEDSIALNFIQNNIEDISLLIDGKLYPLEECNTTNQVKKGKITSTIRCKTPTHKEEELKTIQTFLTSIITHWKEYYSPYYFRYLIHQYENQDIENITQETKVILESTKDKGGIIFE